MFVQYKRIETNANPKDGQAAGVAEVVNVEESPQSARIRVNSVRC